MARPQQQPLIYFHSLELENVRCFGERQVLELTNDKGQLAQWTLLLGDKGQPFQYVPVSCAKLSSRLREPLYLAGR